VQAPAAIAPYELIRHTAMRLAVAITTGRAKLEASGGINDSTLRSVAETAVDLSMRLSL
jgi:nicotinate-nucleotide pyrophosphorylase (carboxylating)